MHPRGSVFFWEFYPRSELKKSLPFTPEPKFPKFFTQCKGPVGHSTVKIGQWLWRPAYSKRACKDAMLFCLIHIYNPGSYAIFCLTLTYFASVTHRYCFSWLTARTECHNLFCPGFMILYTGIVITNWVHIQIRLFCSWAIYMYKTERRWNGVATVQPKGFFSSHKYQ